VNSITKRWVRGSLLVTILMCLVAEAVFLYYSITNYYDGARRAMTTRTSTIITQLNASAAQTGESQGVLLRRMVEQFTEKDKFELMLVNAAGKPLVTSTGFAPDDSVAGEDYLEALASEKGEGHAVYRTAMGEKVMAVTTLLPRAAGEIVAVRFVTSLTLVDQSIAALVAFSLALVTAVVLFSVWTGMFFIRSIVRPIGEIEATAAKIAEGNLDTRIENKYNDEIGKLSDTINHMAGELDKTERMKNEFISSVSHELRTPLTSIKGWVETIAAIRDPADPNFRRGVQVISSEADRLYSMVEELLDFSRMQNGLKLDLQLLDLVAEVSDAAIMVERRVELEGLHLAYDEPEEPMPVMADPARLRQVFINVLDNAVKYSPPHGTVRMDVLSDGNSAFVNISDEGRGIAPDDLENVKVKFFKGKGAVRGSGIGLAVVDEIVTALDGSVDIQSEVGRGTTVTVRLPLYKRPAPSDAPPRGGTPGGVDTVPARRGGGARGWGSLPAAAWTTLAPSVAFLCPTPASRLVSPPNTSTWAPCWTPTPDGAWSLWSRISPFPKPWRIPWRAETPLWSGCWPIRRRWNSGNTRMRRSPGGGSCS